VEVDNNRNRTVYKFVEIEVNSGDKGEFININTPDRFMNSMSKPLNQAVESNNGKWFINLSNCNIPAEVSNLL